MIVERPSAARGHVEAGWLDSRHTFSFGNHYDPQWMGFGPLRVINEDRVAAGAGFPPHRHANMEILTYVLSGALAHRDSASDQSGGGGGVLRPGELQWMSAGHGIEHSEYNASDSEPVHFLQIWIQPDRLNARPAYAQQHFDSATRHGHWTLLASPDGAEGSIAIRQNARLSRVELEAEDGVEYRLEPSRRYWIHVAKGRVDIDGRSLEAGDALGYSDESRTLQLHGDHGLTGEVLLFDLPA